MPVMTQKRIYRSDLKNNPDVFYVFGDNQQRIGLGGQAAEMRGEPNAIGIATKASPSEFWKEDTPADGMRNGLSLINDMTLVVAVLAEGKTVVFPEDGLGTGLSELPQRCPKTFQFLESMIEDLKNI